MPAGISGNRKVMVCHFLFLEVITVYGMNPYQFQFYQQQPQYMQQPQMMQPQEAKITVAQVPTVEQVERVQMLPGERKIVLVQNDQNFLAIRVADNAGFVSTEYRTSQIIDPKSATQQVQYAPVQAVLELKSEIEKLKEMIGVTANAKPNSRDAVRAE